MLVISRDTQSFHDDLFKNFPRHIRPGDCVVLNDSRVFPARLHGIRDHTGGARVELFLIRALDQEKTLWIALVRPGKRARKGDCILFEKRLQAEIIAEGDFGERTVHFSAPQPVAPLLEEAGETPLPPYIHRAPDTRDRERYQTIFAQEEGSAAAPTAGLHFTPETLEACRIAGAEIAAVTLHVGLGTFAPVRGKQVEKIRLHEELFEISEANAARMRAARRLLCVGTTSVRSIETAALREGLYPIKGETNLFIYPGFRFRAAGALLTNFHLPQSSLLMLVCAFAGRELTLAAYRHAVAQRYRFFSYGDCMLIE